MKKRGQIQWHVKVKLPDFKLFMCFFANLLLKDMHDLDTNAPPCIPWPYQRRFGVTRSFSRLFQGKIIFYIVYNGLWLFASTKWLNKPRSYVTVSAILSYLWSNEGTTNKNYMTSMFIYYKRAPVRIRPALSPIPQPLLTPKQLSVYVNFYILIL